MAHDRLHNLPARAFVIATMFAILCLSAPRPGGAAEPHDRDEAREKARTILARGAELYAKANFSAALAHFQSAHALFPSPKIHYNIALAHAGMGQQAQALAALERFLREAPDAPPEHLADAREQAKRLSKKVAFLTIAGGTAGAEAFLDGALIGKTPLAGRLPIDVGPHAVVVRGTTPGNLDVIRCADHVLDLGPEGGAGGGRLMAAGTPEHLAGMPESATGAFLRPLLAKPD